MPVRAYIGLGSNIDAERNVRAALHELQRSVRVVGLSTFYRTAPIGHAGDPWFVNGVLAIDTDLAPVDLKRDVLRHVENDLGRCRGADPDAPRTIDLDLLLVEGEETLSPDVRERAFVAWPLAEIAPQLELDGRRIGAIAERLPREGMIALPELTAALREEVKNG